MTELLFRAFALDPGTDRETVLGVLERVLAEVNGTLGTTFTHDGEEADGNVTYTVWTDDPEGPTESSWVRLTDDDDRGALLVEINATTDAILDGVTAKLIEHAPVTQRIDHAPRPF